MTTHTARTFLELSETQEAEIEMLVNLDVPANETRLRLVSAPAGVSRAEAEKINEPSRAVTNALFRWNTATIDRRGVDAARAAFVAALIRAGVPAR